MIKIGITDIVEVRQLCDIATEIVGLEQGSLTTLSRKEPYAIARQVVANISLGQGIHFVTIAKALNRKRSNIYHYQKRHTLNFKTWVQYRNIFTKVFNVYKESKKEQKTFLNKQDLRSFLFKNGVSTSTGEVFIVVKSGVLKTVINTSYKDFSNQLENMFKTLIYNNNEKVRNKVVQTFSDILPKEKIKKGSRKIQQIN